MCWSTTPAESARFAPFEQLTDDDWLENFNFNVLSAVRATRAVLPYMQKQKWGTHHQHLQRIGNPA